MNRNARKQYVDDLTYELIDHPFSWVAEATLVLACEAAYTYKHGCYLASLFVAIAAIESHLRSRHWELDEKNLVGLSANSSLAEPVRHQIEELRAIRNQWVHVEDPHSKDDDLFIIDAHREEMATNAHAALETMRVVLRYDGPNS